MGIWLKYDMHIKWRYAHTFNFLSLFAHKLVITKFAGWGFCSKHQADIHPSSPTELPFFLCSRPLDGVFAMCPALLALVEPHQWLIEHVESAAGAASEALHTLGRPTSDSHSCSLLLCGHACFLNLRSGSLVLSNCVAGLVYSSRFP